MDEESLKRSTCLHTSNQMLKKLNMTYPIMSLGCTDEEKIFSGYLPTDPYFIPKISSKSVSHFDGSVDIELTSQSSNSLPDSTPKGTPSLLSYPLLRRSNIKYVFDGEIRRKTPKSPHQHLSEVQCRGYFGDINDVELAMYFFENTLALEKFIVDPCVELQHNCEGTQRARDRAMLQLQPKVPQGVKLIII
ncbi:hypothetical protein T459_17111 [Capsicum annuum]|uniref:FBD domain-containing protein n=1 Tax=Capsicum annuum TaxID=4072 RepID=A0A2G2ZAQ7_CAPAN|nr:hypothetical protein T459_17111 [Capsicum annuum]